MRIRRGPAAVIGDDGRSPSHALGAHWTQVWEGRDPRLIREPEDLTPDRFGPIFEARDHRRDPRTRPLVAGPPRRGFRASLLRLFVLLECTLYLLNVTTAVQLSSSYYMY